VADLRENHAGAYCRTDYRRDENDARPVDETWGRGEITPFGMELPTHFYSPGRADCPALNVTSTSRRYVSL
jgi:hypothetical protein